MADVVLQDRIMLRIDVDYPNLLPGAVPFMLDVLASAGMKATFFVTAGAGKSSALSRLASPAYWLRLYKLRAWRMLPCLLRQRAVGNENLACIIARIKGEGHEVAVHGYDHGWWMENVSRAADAEIRADIDKAFSLVENLTGDQGLAWGSPGWMTSDNVMNILYERKVPYFAECWGNSPFVTSCSGRDLTGVPHLSITLPSFESLVLHDGINEAAAVSKILQKHTAGKYDMMVCHDYFEGYLRKDLFSKFVNECSARNITTVTLREIADELKKNGNPLPSCRVGATTVPGFLGRVSCQEKVLL